MPCHTPVTLSRRMARNLRKLTWARAAVASIAVLGSVFVGAGEASAHASLLASTPAYGSTLSVAPSTVQLQFDNPIEPGLVKVRLKEEGTEREIGKGTLVGERTPRAGVEFTLPAHGPGSYFISWVSFAFDGHIVSGTIPYTVDPNATAGGQAGEPGVEDQPGEATVEPLVDSGKSNRVIDIVEIQLRFLMYLGLAAVLGGSLWRIILPKSGEGAAMLLKTARDGAFAGGMLAAVMAVLRCGCEIWRILDAGYGAGELGPQFASGQLSGYVLAAGLFTLAAMWTRRDESAGRAWRPILAAGGAAFLTAALGHAAGKPAPGIGAVLMGAHLVAAAIWVGSVGILAYVATDTKFSSVETRWGELREGLNSLGAVLLTAGGVLALTGARAAYIYGDGMPAGAWGATLSVKLLLGLGGGTIGLFHYLRGRRGQALNNKTLAVEACLLVLVMTAAAVLSVTVPA